jgi:hypothetical protein
MGELSNFDFLGLYMKRGDGMDVKKIVGERRSREKSPGITC